jgi:hypothetical protein
VASSADPTKIGALLAFTSFCQATMPNYCMRSSKRRRWGSRGAAVETSRTVPRRPSPNIAGGPRASDSNAAASLAKFTGVGERYLEGDEDRRECLAPARRDRVRDPRRVRHPSSRCKPMGPGAVLRSRCRARPAPRARHRRSHGAGGGAPLAMSPIKPGPDLPAGPTVDHATLNSAAAGRAGGRRRGRRCSADAGRIG